MTDDTRYPYTYSADFIRSLAGHRLGLGGTKISRADASAILNGIATALSMDSERLARGLADYYKANEAEISKNSVNEFLSIFDAQSENRADETN